MSTHKAFTTDTDQWWDPKGPFWTLHAINPIRLDFILQYTQSQKALDVGCGGGILSESLSPYFDVLGIDIDQNLIQVAKNRSHTCQYMHASTSDIAEEHKNHFDLITCLEVLEHVKNPQQIIHDIASMTKPGGYVFISTLNRNLISFLSSIVIAEHLLNMIPVNTHHYEHFIKPTELIEWGYTHGLTLVNIKGICYNPIKSSFYLSQSSAVNYIVCFKK